MPSALSIVAAFAFGLAAALVMVAAVKALPWPVLAVMVGADLAIGVVVGLAIVRRRTS